MFLSRDAFDLGEKILQDSKDTKDQQDRLKRIEEELVELQTQVENEVKTHFFTETCK